MSRRSTTFWIIALLATAISACSGDSAGSDPVTPVVTAASTAPAATATSLSTPVEQAGDPSERGPFAVGLTRMKFERTDRDGALRTLDTWIWYPSEGAPSATVRSEAPPASVGAPFPLIIFSHGSGGQPNHATFLTEHLASWGYIVAAPPHPGNTSDDCVNCGIDVILRSASERVVDVPYVLEAMLALRDDGSNALGKIIDGERTGVAGHSFGGWTAIFMAPGDRFDVSVAMAPGEPRLALEPARKMTSPALIMAGEKDEIVNPDNIRDLVAEVPAQTPLIYISFPEGHHLTFIDNCLGCTDALTAERGHELTLRYVTAFLQVYLIGDPAYGRYLVADPPDALFPGQ